MEPKSVKSRVELISYLSSLLEDYDSTADQWENKDTHSFLHALAAWLNDCDGY